MKKVISLFLALTFVFTLAACSNNQPQTNDSSESLSEPTTESTETPADTSDPESSESENGKTLVVYFPPQATRKQQPITSHRKPAATCSNWNRQNPTQMKI